MCPTSLPPSARDRVIDSRARYTRRFARLQSELHEIACALEQRGIPFVVLKGFTHSPSLTPDPIVRAQGDIDLWFPLDQIGGARTVLLDLGYRSRHAQSDGSRHLPPMARPNGWQWHGDVFDPDMPVHVEAHHTLWSDTAEYIVAPGQTDFWNRRVTRDFDGWALPVLSPPDLLGFASLHFLLHLLHGDLPLQRAWEIAFFLHSNARNDAFWSRWRQLHQPSLRGLEGLSFAIAKAWFHCDAHPAVQREMDGLTHDVQLWLRHFAFSPLCHHGQPNKDEVWLHLALVHSSFDRARILLRRLFPFVLTCKGGLSPARLTHHWRTFTPTLRTGLHWLHLKREPASLP